MARTRTSTPAADGFRMPAEWEPHDGCWMLWPQRPDAWRWGGKPAQEAFAAVAAAVAAGGDPVTVGVDARQYAAGRAAPPPEARGPPPPPGAGGVELPPAAGGWRAAGPTFVVDGRGGRRAVDWPFNA